MSLKATPYKLVPGGLEARLLRSGKGDPLPGVGQILRLRSGGQESTLYCVVDWLELREGGAVASEHPPDREPRSPKRITVVGLTVLHGQAAMRGYHAVIVDEAELGKTVYDLQTPVETPLVLFDNQDVEATDDPDASDDSSQPAYFPLDYDRLGSLTVVDGAGRLEDRYSALVQLAHGCAAYSQVLVIDPIGLELGTEGMVRLEAGRDWRLSLAEINTRDFLNCFANTLPDALQEAALKTVANFLPMGSERFTSLSTLFALQQLAEFPARNLILQNLAEVAATGLFAEEPQQVFQWNKPLPGRITVLDISALPGPWIDLFYDQVCRDALHEGMGDVTLALVYPDIHLKEAETWVRTALEMDANIIAMPFHDDVLKARHGSSKPASLKAAKPFVGNSASDTTWSSLAGNVLTVFEATGQFSIQGKVTLGLPVQYPLFPLPAWIMPDDGESFLTLDDESDDDYSQSASTPSMPDWDDREDGRSAEISSMPTLQSEGLFPEYGQEAGLNNDSFAQGEALGNWETGGLPEDTNQANQGMTQGTIQDSSLQGFAIDPDEYFSVAPVTGKGVAGTPGQATTLVESGTAQPPIEDAVPTYVIPGNNDYPPAEEFLGFEDGATTSPGLEPISQPLPHEAGVPGMALGESSLDQEFDSGYIALNQPDASDEVGEAQNSFNDEDSDDWSPAFDPDLDPNFHDSSSLLDEGKANETTSDISSSDLLNDMLANQSTGDENSEDDEFGFSFDSDLFQTEGEEPDEMQEHQPPERQGYQPEPTYGQYGEGGYASVHQAEEPEQMGLEPSSSLSSLDEVLPVRQRQSGDDGQQEAGSDEGETYQLGDRVIHPQYGPGVVMKVLPMGEHTILNITFDQVGKRLLDPSLCTLTRE